MNDVLYERELTYGRSTVRVSVWLDEEKEVWARLIMEPSSGGLHLVSMDVTPEVLDGIETMVADARTILVRDEARRMREGQ